MYRKVSTRKSDYLYRELQFGRSARLSNLIVRQHHYAAVRWHCLPTSIRGEASEGRFRSQCRAFVDESERNRFARSPGSRQQDPYVMILVLCVGKHANL
jgi:hypothetical protein